MAQGLNPTANEEIGTFEELYQYWRMRNPGCSPSTYREIQSVVTVSPNTLGRRPLNWSGWMLHATVFTCWTRDWPEPPLPRKSRSVARGCRRLWTKAS